jgi:hypothetical protein
MIQAHVEKHKKLIDNGIWVTFTEHKIPFDGLQSDHLVYILRLLDREGLMWYWFAQKLVAIAQNRNLQWKEAKKIGLPS